jgi:hypothetical protein
MLELRLRRGGGGNSDTRSGAVDESAGEYFTASYMSWPLATLEKTTHPLAILQEQAALFLYSAPPRAT